MMPLSLTNPGETVLVFRVKGNNEAKQHLADLGFVPGTPVTVVSQNGGDVIVNIKDSHLALTREMATRIDVEPVHD
jgi:ferrous iron transport protein A